MHCVSAPCKFLGAAVQCQHVFLSLAAMTRAFVRKTRKWRRVLQIIILQRPGGNPPYIVVHRPCKFLGTAVQCQHVFVSLAKRRGLLDAKHADDVAHTT
jgi:hypothetical protein